MLRTMPPLPGSEQAAVLRREDFTGKTSGARFVMRCTERIITNYPNLFDFPSKKGPL